MPTWDLAGLNEEDATELVLKLIKDLQKARDDVDRMERRAAGIRKMIEGLVEMYPAAEDLLPADLDDDDEPRPRGADALRRVLDESPGVWFTVSSAVRALDRQGWLPHSSNPSNAVRSALERLVDQHEAKKSRSNKGAVIYQSLIEARKNDLDEEPF